MIEKLQYRKIETIKKNPKNPRRITDAQFKILCESIKNNPDYFEARPLILSNRTGELVIIAGNQRYEAAIKLGLREVPTFLLENLTEEREREIIARDNVENGDWDYDILANEWDVAKLQSWGVDIGDIKIDVAIKEEEKPEIPFAEELLEEHNYVVLYFDNSVDWLQALTLFDIKTVRYKLSGFGEKTGIGRVLRGVDAINKIRGIKDV